MLECTVRFESSEELGQFAYFWDSIMKSRNQVATESKTRKPEDNLKEKMEAESEKIKSRKAKKVEDPKADNQADPPADSGQDPTGDPVCTPQEFVEAVRKWHGQDPSTRTAIIQHELDALGVEKLQAVQPKDYPGFLAGLGVSK